MPSTVQLTTAISTATRLWGSTCGIPRFMIDLSIASKRRSKTRPCMLRPSTAKPAIEPSGAMKLCNSTYEARRHMLHTCEGCDQIFSSDEALEQHLRDSSVHAPSFGCEECDRSFSCNEALRQHLRDSPVHALSFKYGFIFWQRRDFRAASAKLARARSISPL